MDNINIQIRDKHLRDWEDGFVKFCRAAGIFSHVGTWFVVISEYLVKSPGLSTLSLRWPMVLFKYIAGQQQFWFVNCSGCPVIILGDLKSC